MKSKKIAQLAIAALEDMKGQSIRCINVEKLTAITDYMIIATGTSSTHIRALADSVVVKLKEAGQTIAGVEGKMQSEWVLVDAGGAVVHIMMAPVRALYNLEELWDFKDQNGIEREEEMALMHSVVSERKDTGKKPTRKKYQGAKKRSTGTRTAEGKKLPGAGRKPAANSTVPGKTTRRRTGKTAE